MDQVLSLPEGTRIQVCFPLPRSSEVTHEAIVSNLRAMGFLRLVADGVALDLSGPEAAEAKGLDVDLSGASELLVVVDRLKVQLSLRDRLADSLGTCFVEGDGEAIVVAVIETEERRLLFTERFRCPDHPQVTFTDPSPQLFSFNNPYGTCQLCTGFGATLDYDVDLVVPKRGSLSSGWCSRSMGQATIPARTREIEDIRDRRRRFDLLTLGRAFRRVP